MGKKKRLAEQKARTGAVKKASAPVSALCVFLALLAFIAYLQVFQNGFVLLDDNSYVLENPNVQQGLNPAAVAWAFTQRTEVNWHPLTWISHTIDYSLYQDRASGHHFTNVLFHVANTLLLFLFLYLATGFAWRSAFVAALFAVHPLHVESVAWVAERKDVLSTFFWLLTMLAYLWYAKKPRIGRYALVFLGLALGLMSKPMVVSLPIVLLIMDYWPLGRNRGENAVGFGKLFLEKVPLFALSLAGSVVTYLYQSNVGAVESVPLAHRLGNAVIAYAAYLIKMILPINLAVIYPIPVGGPALWKVVASAVLLAALAILVFKLRRKHPYVAAGALWYVVTLVPVIGIVQVGWQSMADRYTYIPLIGIFFAIAWAVPNMLSGRKLSPSTLPALSAAVILVFTILTWVQTGYWKDTTTLMQHAVNVTSGNYDAECKLGGLKLQNGQVDAALALFRKSAAGKPDYPEPHFNIGSVQMVRGETREAIDELRTAVRLNPTLADRAVMVIGQGKTDDIIRFLESDIKKDPKDAVSHLFLSAALKNKGEYRRAWEQVHLAQSAGGGIPPEFLAELSGLMPDPGR